eukprot:gnl/TRDRNA2_/TRDRNA2_49137_c0_seq1.p1 gnl/TRDRNA2_/TRDRNA2_49137_c0~~gnl/TRDRNA2_/TRDRNA2_49137_c0_seq1.p1  ORF type:complete len:110 (+),score=33.26 gnl/TRDRNA2_/TRDRNA2_49137_c0_seq1:57-386(+)
MPIGTVKKWFDDKGFGFIIMEDGKDGFVHIKDLMGDDKVKGYLKSGEKVTYQPEWDDSKGKYKASYVKSADSSSSGGGGGDEAKTGSSSYGKSSDGKGKSRDEPYSRRD